MSALLTYRSRNSFESRFGRNTPDPSRRQTIQETPRPGSASEAHFHIHNDGHKTNRPANSRTASQSVQASQGGDGAAELASDPQFHGPKPEGLTGGEKAPSSTYFSAQSYLRYQGGKFVKRFDSNCYIAITRKLDTHDVSRDRSDTVAGALAMIEQPTLVLGIESDGLFTFEEQQELADHIKNAKLEKIDSPEGHDAFLLQFEQVNKHILDFLHDVLPDIMQRGSETVVESSIGQLTKSSTFGEAEVSHLQKRNLAFRAKI